MSSYLTNLFSEKRLKQIMVSFWALLALVTGLICLVNGVNGGFQSFLMASGSNVLLFVLFCSSLLKLALIWQGGFQVAAVRWGLLVSEVVSLNPITAAAMLLSIRQSRGKKQPTVTEAISLVMLLILGGLQLLLYLK